MAKFYETAVLAELREASGGLPAGIIGTLEETASRSIASRNLNMLVLTMFGCVSSGASAAAIHNRRSGQD